MLKDEDVRRQEEAKVTGVKERGKDRSVRRGERREKRVAERCWNKREVSARRKGVKRVNERRVRG